MRYVCKNPPGGGGGERNPYQLIDYKVLEFKSFCIFSGILSLLIILIKPLTTKAYDRSASGDCGTSGLVMFLSCLFSKSFSYLDFSL